ncbi:MAG: Na/Pi cotransporter family protein [Clostridia bacterium]|nr:Na/Pi cotransporter family protein [Clostridia bacterium]
MILPLIGGLCLFLFGMNTMGESLERRAGGALRSLLGKLTTNKFAGFLTGLGVTAVIQSSSATTVMVVGFVNSGIMTLKQAINVIMGANVGTTVTAWILSMAGIEGSVWLNLLKPTSFTPVLAVIGIIMCMFTKDSKKKDTGTILLGFATLMFGMDMMSGAMKPLGEMEWFQNLFIMFENPILGLLAGAILTAIIQSSSASVGILQALAQSTGLSFGAAIPIIMGQNIGTCITAILSSAGTTKNAKRAALVHLSFNVIGAVSLLVVFTVVKTVFASTLSPLLATNASAFGIAIAHSAFNILCVLILLPISSLLEKLAIKLIPDAKTPEAVSELDERLLATPALALERCHVLTMEMAETSSNSILLSLDSLDNYNEDTAKRIREAEDLTDHYEDILSTYLVKLGGHSIGEAESAEATELLKLIGDFERIADHSVNVLESAEELREKGLQFSKNAQNELTVLKQAVREIVDLTMSALTTGDLAIAAKVEPLEQIIDDLKEELRTRHIVRLSQGNCSIEVGFVWSDLLTNLERVSDHCSNISACIIDTAHNNLNLHESTRTVHQNDTFYAEQLEEYKKQYQLA